MAKQRWGRILIPVFLALAGAGAVWLLGGFSRREKELLPPGNTTAEGDTSAVSITVEPVTFRPVQRTIEAVGTLYGYEEVSLCTKVEGRVRKIHHEVSDRVQPGEVLLEIDPLRRDVRPRLIQGQRQAS